MDYFKKGNSKMLVIICPTTGETSIDNLNAVLRVVELSGGKIFEPHKFVENFYYGIIDKAEKEFAAEFESDIQFRLAVERADKIAEELFK